ncbi:MAG: toprim domain-containing protein [Candidatus Hydrothermarchaeota archaeon]
MKRKEITKIEKLEAWIKELKQASEKKPIVVEGKKDKEALEKLGITGDIYTIQSLGTLTKVIDNISNHEEVIVLTDLDKKGTLIYEKLKKRLESRGIKVIYRYRRDLREIIRINNIEALYSHIKRLRENLGFETENL